MECLSAPFKQLYDSFINRCFLGGLDLWYLPFEPLDERNACVSTGFAVNKDVNELLRCRGLQRGFHYQVLDHIRVIEEVFSGIFKTENKEFNQINHIFIREFMLSSIYIVYSPEFRDYELQLAQSIALKNKEDPIERLEKSYPDCSFRLLRRVPVNDGKWRWDAVLSGVQNIEVILQDDQRPIRFSFNEGQLFMRLYQIFAQYEAQMQTHKLLFNALHKIGDINGEDIKSIQTKQKQFEEPGVFTSTAINQTLATTTVENLELIPHITALRESYDIISTTINDSLSRLGLAGDDSTKCERITTGENFRALQPNMAFQEAIINRLETVTERLKIHFSVDVKFEKSIKPNEQGIPMVEKEEGMNNE